METNIGIAAESRSTLVALLGTVLADEHVLYIKTRGFHWNVRGPRFHDLHLFFEQLYGGMEETMDAIAERMRALGGDAPGSMQAFLTSARLVEVRGPLPDADGMLATLLDDHETLIRALRADIARIERDLDDVGTADFLTGLIAAHEKTAWMLRATVAR